MWAVARGRSQWQSREPPTAWAIAVQALVAALVVTAYLPLAWDRYLLSLQGGSALLAAGVTVAAVDRFSSRIVRVMRTAGFWVFVILLGSYTFFWQARDWNTASRLMLTYALVDRGTVVIDGLDDQTGDKAFFCGHYYSDKLPGSRCSQPAPMRWRSACSVCRPTLCTSADLPTGAPITG